MIKVLAFGTFDILHPGHLSFLKQARQLGDHLTVVVARDVNVLKIKGRQPQESEKIRLAKVKKTKIPDVVILGYKNYQKRLNLINKFKPQIICLGYDQPTIKITQQNIKIIHAKAFYPKLYKSHLLVKHK